jgi:hypothetical protein
LVTGAGAGAGAFCTCAMAGSAIAAPAASDKKRLAPGCIGYVHLDRLRRDLTRLAGQKPERSCEDEEDDDKE